MMGFFGHYLGLTFATMESLTSIQLAGNEIVWDKIGRTRVRGPRFFHKSWSIGSEVNRTACEIIKVQHDFLADRSEDSSFALAWLRFWLAWRTHTFRNGHLDKKNCTALRSLHNDQISLFCLPSRQQFQAALAY